ncbi:unnamed protein product [Rhizoctonia solani]|uniref:BTB domain-containing protein n=1 Tax=Rhizoctonia solani TaxID=456999 RepID=A0A8H2X5U5_9AGAM|nr:unnamed protein product [Rhizoctonia solani]
MPKRSSTGSVASESSVTTRSQKRAKVDETEGNPSPNPTEEANEEPEVSPEENDEEKDRGSYEENTEENHEENHKENSEEGEPIIRDPKYYFDDGNLVLCVKHVLFKIHASLFKAHSEDFFNRLNPQAHGSTEPGGTCDEDAIIISDVQPSRLRNLMRVIYCLPSKNAVFRDKKAVVDNFVCYLDVAVLSRKFGMEAMQQWAEKELAKVARNSGIPLAVQLEDFYDKESDSDDELYVEDGPGYYTAHVFVEAIQYARAVSHHTLLQDMLSILEYYASCLESNVMFFVTVFRIEDLRTTEPSLFGFFFLLLLDCGNQTWIEKSFTQEERMALFSAQSFLTPLPKSLKASIFTPLFRMPTDAKKFATILSEGKCKDGCHKEIFSHWKEAFTVDYYDDVNGREFSDSIEALATLPFRRLNFVTGVSRVKCLPCRRAIIGKLDEGMQEVFARLGGYYKVYE